VRAEGLEQVEPRATVGRAPHLEALFLEEVGQHESD
jgi:hypothetical protein